MESYGGESRMNMKKKLLILLAAVFLFKVLVIVYFKTYAHPVMWEFEGLVNSVLSGKGYVYNFLGTDYRSLNTPLYSLICLAIYAVTNHSYFVVLLLQSLVTIFLAFTIFNIAKTIFDETTGFVSAAVVALHPAFMYYDAFNLVPLSIDTFFVAIITFLFMKFQDRPSFLKMLAVGALIGLGTLSRGIVGAILPFLGLYFILCVKGITLRRKSIYIAAIALATFIVIAPWTVRNYLVHKDFVFISSTTGENLYRGNNPYATGVSLTADGKSVRELWPKEVSDKIAGLDEIGQKKFFEKEAMNFIMNDPAAFVKLYLKKIYYFWWFSPQSGFLYPKAYLSIYKFFYSIVIIFSLIGIALASSLKGADRRRDALLVIFVILSVCIAQSFFYVEGRHRWLVEPLLLIFFSYGVTRSFEFVLKRKIN